MSATVSARDAFCSPLIRESRNILRQFASPLAAPQLKKKKTPEYTASEPRSSQATAFLPLMIR